MVNVPEELSEGEDFRDRANSISGASIEEFWSRMPLEQRAVGVGRPQPSTSAMSTSAIRSSSGSPNTSDYESSQDSSILQIVSFTPTPIPNIVACYYMFENRIHVINLSKNDALTIDSATLASKIIKSVRWIN